MLIVASLLLIIVLCQSHSSIRFIQNVALSTAIWVIAGGELGLIQLR